MKVNYEREKKNPQTFLSFIFRIMCPGREREREGGGFLPKKIYIPWGCSSIF